LEIREQGEGQCGTNPQQEYEAQRDSESPLALEYMTEYETPPFVVRHIVQTQKDGVINFFVLPGDAMGNRIGIEEARAKGAYIQAVLDMPPQPVSNPQALYYKESQSIGIFWTNPLDSDLEDIELQLVKAGAAGPVESGSAGKTGTRTVLNIPRDNSVYTVTLWARDKFDNRSDPVSVTVTANDSIPSPVSGLTGRYDRAGTRIELSWDDPPDSDLKEILVEWGKTGQGTSPAGVAKGAETYSIPGISEDGSEYTVSVKAVNNYDAESAPVSVALIADLSPPGEVTNLSAVYNPVLGVINVNWTDPADPDFNSLRLTRGLTTVTVLKGQQGYAINNIPGDLAEHTISLKTADRAGNESAGQTVTVIADGVAPGLVRNLTGTYEPAAQRITLGWEDPPDSDLKELQVQWGKIGQSQSVTTVAKGAGSWFISNIPGDMSQYAVSVRSVDMLGNVSAAETGYIEADGIPPGPVSSLIAAYDKTAEQITLSWADPFAADLKEIRLEWGLTGQSTNPVTIAKGAETCTIPNIPEDNRQYTISLRSVDYTGNESAAAVRTVAAAEPPPPPPPPEGISAVHTPDSGELAVSWSAAPGAAAYEVWYSTVNNSAGATRSPDVSETAKTLTGLTNGTLYYIWLRSKNAAGTGNFSAPVTGTPKNNVAALGNITVNGQSIAGFSAHQFTGYAAHVAWDSGNVAVAGIPAAGSGASVSYSPAQPMALEPGASQLVTITVTAQNGTAQQDYSIRVTKKKDFSLIIIGPEEENITLEYATGYGDPPVLSYTAGHELSFTVTGTYQAVNWFVDGSLKGSGASFAVKARDYLPAAGGKTYTLTVVVTKNGLLYSRDMSFTVTR
jgi:hypothetical protein